MMVGMGYIGLDSGRLYRMRRGPKLIEAVASGTTIIINDATEGRPFRGLRVFGRMKQVQTTGAQLIKPIGKFPYKLNGVEAVRNLDGSYTLTGTATTNGNFRIVDPDIENYALNINEVTLSLGVSGGTFDGECLVSDATKGDWETLLNVTFHKTATGKIQCNKVGMFIAYKAQTTYNVTLYPMLNSGPSALPWEPYTGGKPSPSPEYPQEIVSAGESGNITVEVGGKNLLTGRLYFTNYSNGIPHVYNEDEVALPYAPSSETHGIGYVVPCKPGVQYTFSVTNPNKNWYLGIAEYENFEQAKSFLNKIGFQQGTEKSSIKYTAVGNGVLVCAIAGKWTDGKTTTHECTESELLQLEYGSEATTYEPYRIPQILTLQTPNGLPGVPVSKDGNYTDADGQQWVCDEIDLERGKYVQRVKEINPADYDRWISDKTTGNLRFKIIGTDAAKKTVRSEILSNRFTFLSSGHMLGGSFTYNSDVYFYLPSTVTTVEECKQWFVDNQTTIYYQLETPIERDLTPEEIAAYKALHTNYPTTVISNDAGAHMEVAYVADTKNYIHNLEERLNAKLVNIQSALISQKISGGWGGIKVTDSSRVPVVRFAMWGKTEQVRTSGKNLFDISSLKKYEINNNNLKASVVDGKIILEGKGVTTKEVIFFCLNKTDDLLKLNPGKYTLSFKSNMPTGTAHESKTVEAFAIIKKADGSSDYSSTGNKGWTTFDIAEGDMMYLRFDINNGTMSAEFYDIQLEYGSSATAYEPYSGNFPSPSPDWEQPIEITDQPVTVTVKGGTEQQSITLSPPKPMTKWDKLEKVDGVWCWVYQSRWVESYTDENITGEYISTTGELSAGADVYYRTDTPESIPLSPSEQDKLNTLTMYAPETEITNTGGCNMELTYTVDTKSYIDKKIAEISPAVLEV